MNIELLYNLSGIFCIVQLVTSTAAYIVLLKKMGWRNRTFSSYVVCALFSQAFIYVLCICGIVVSYFTPIKEATSSIVLLSSLMFFICADLTILRVYDSKGKAARNSIKKNRFIGVIIILIMLIGVIVVNLLFPSMQIHGVYIFFNCLTEVALILLFTGSLLLYIAPKDKYGIKSGLKTYNAAVMLFSIVYIVEILVYYNLYEYFLYSIPLALIFVVCMALIVVSLILIIKGIFKAKKKLDLFI